MSYLLKKKKPTKGVTFRLAPRPQKDPLAADYEAPQNILVPKDGQDLDEIRKKLPDFAQEIFPSKEETKKGMLERAHNADGVTFDPDLLEAMSKDFDYEDPNNILNDDFMEQAGGLIEEDGELLDGEVTELANELFEDEPEVILFRPDDKEEDEEEEGEEELDSDDDDYQERRTVFSNYSMTSSVMRRSKGLEQIDEHFERLYEKEYADDTEIGALDLNEVQGEELLKHVDQIKQLKNEVKVVRKRNHGDDYKPEIVSEHHKNAIIGDDPAAEEEDLVEVEFQKRENRVDCESVLSYNSTLYNHPRLIVEPRRKTSSQSTTDQMETCSDVRSRSGGARSIASSRATIVSRLSYRPQDESVEDKRIRKKALKQYRRDRRQERKQNQQIFKKEKDNLMNQQLTNLTGLKLH